jgi:hypothetical protein
MFPATGLTSLAPISSESLFDPVRSSQAYCIPDLSIPENLDEFRLQMEKLWPKHRWHSGSGFAKVLQVYRDCTSPESDIARMNRFILGFWCPSPDRICYSLPRLRKQLDRSRSLLNAAFTAWGWQPRPSSEEEEWRPALKAAVPQFRFNPADMRCWTIRGSDSESGPNSGTVAIAQESSFVDLEKE